MDESKDGQKTAGLALVLLGVGALQYALFSAVGEVYLEGWKLGIGSIGLPRARMVYFLAFWGLLGGGAVLVGSAGVAAAWRALRLDERLPWASDETVSGDGQEVRDGHAQNAGRRDRIWVGVGMVVAAAVPWAIRSFVLQGAPLTDDESAYRFMAHLLASGQVAADSLPEGLRLFFDRFQMVNGGQWYSQYFVGWPALMVPGVWLGIEAWMNVVYSALTVPPLFWVARAWFGRRAARWAVVLYVASPFLMVAAAGVGAHTSCMAALAWTLYFFARTRPDEARWWDDAGFGGLFAVAFFVRPLTAIGIGAPLVLIWLAERVRGWDRSAALRILAFGVPTAVLAGLFLWVNAAQTGSPLTPAYTAYRDFVVANGGRFTDMDPATVGVPNLNLGDLADGLAVQGVALFRFNFALFGWPCSLFLALLAGLRDRAWILWAAFGTFFAAHFIASDPGIDLYGPVHYMELALPVILLSAAGLVRARRFLADREPGATHPVLNPRWPAAAAATSIVVAAAGYLPVRLGAVETIADTTRTPEAAVEQLDLGPAVVFSPRPFVSTCALEHSRHYVFWRPTNPRLEAPVLWVNHISVADDCRFMRHAPGRTGYVMLWNPDCKLEFVPLEEADPKVIPDGLIGGSKHGPDWEQAPSPDTYTLPEPSR